MVCRGPPAICKLQTCWPRSLLPSLPCSSCRYRPVVLPPRLRRSAPRETPLRGRRTGLTTAVFSGAKWRADQKEPRLEPRLREAAALRGMEDFLGRTGCLAVAGIQRLPDGRALASHEELLQRQLPCPSSPTASCTSSCANWGRGMPVIVQGGTEVLVDVQVLDIPNSARLANTRTSWRNGGHVRHQGRQDARCGHERCPACHAHARLLTARLPHSPGVPMAVSWNPAAPAPNDYHGLMQQSHPSPSHRSRRPRAFAAG